MRGFAAWILVFFALTGAVLGICLLADSGVRTADVGAAIPEGIRESNYVLTGWKTSLPCSFTLTIPSELTNEKFELVFCEMNSFSLTCNGKLIYSYDSDNGYQRLHMVELPLADDGIYTLSLASESIIGRNRILLATLDNSRSSFLTAYGANMVTIGAFLLTIVYCLTLYAQKHSESYLLLIACLSVVALVSAFSNSTQSIPGIDNIGEPVRFFRITFCAALCPILLHVHLPKKWGLLYGWPGILGCTLLLYILYRAGLQDVSNELSYLLVVPAGLACADGCVRKEPFARIFTAGVVIREALRVFYRLIQAGAIVCPPAFFYYYIPQLSSFIFVLGCIILINGRFASKFREVDLLAGRLEEANAYLDAKVELRTQDLKLANERLVREQDRKHGIMLNIFHDLRTPIFAAMGSAENIRPADERSEKSLAVLSERLDFLQHLSEELFFLAKLEEGQITFERFRVRLDDFCPPVAAGFEALAQNNGLEFAFSLELGLLITADAYRFKQALENLLMNAVKYTDRGRVTFAVYSKGAEALFAVSDTGPGIPKTELPNLFDRYYQGSLVRGPESAGLGLSIALAIVQVHGGTITVESEVGKGSTFTLKIPLEREED